MSVEDLRVSRGWLGLREPADAAARAADLVEHLGGELPATGRRVIHDLGCGTGAMGRWLAPLLPGPQHWALHDRDPDLLALAAADLPGPAANGAAVTVETKRTDITRLQPRDLADAALITASALLDMLTEEELAGLVAGCARAGGPILVTLSVVGRVRLSPADPLDRRVAAAFDAHQRRATERGRLLGPDAVTCAVEEFGRLGAEVLVRPSPWTLGAPQAELAAEWFSGWVRAACEQEAELTVETEVYARRRLAQAAAGELAVTVDHADLLVVPRGTPGISPRREREVEGVRTPSRLRRQVAGVRGGQVHARRHPRGHGHPEPAELPGLVRVVAEQRDSQHPQRLQHLRGDQVAALVLAVAQREIRLIGVQPRVLQRVGVELGVQADATSLLPQIQQVATGVGDALDGFAQLRAAVAPLTAEHVPSEALAVRPDQRHPPTLSGRDSGGPIAQPQGEVLLPVDQPVEAEHSGRRGVPVGEPQGNRQLGANRRGWQ
jgi:hypothetical protein